MPSLTESRTTHVGQSTFRVSTDPTEIFSTVLGSCVAACMHDARRKVGGMNHFLLPADASGNSGSLRYGINLMEQLINEMLKQGATKRTMVAKVFGGANVAVGGSTVGARNGEFVKSFLDREGIPFVAQSLGGERARRLRFWPSSGRVSQLLLTASDVTSELTNNPSRPIEQTEGHEPEVWA